MSNTNFIDEFLKNTIKQAFGENLPEEIEQEFVERLKLLLAKRIGIEMTKQLKDEDLKELAKLSEEKKLDLKKVLDFYKEKIPNFEEELVKIIKNFREEYLKLAQEMK